MKTKKTLGIFAMVLTAFACAFPGTAKAAGDIRSIQVYQDAETTERIYPNANAPLVAGETVKFRIRLLNRGHSIEKMAEDPTFRNPWTLQHVGGNDPIADTNNMPQVGLWISGQRKYAKVESWQLADDYFTDMICSYTVKPGDLAMPLKLVNPAGTGEALDVEGASSSDYFVKNIDLWNWFPASNEGSTASNKLEFYFGPTALDVGTYPIQVINADTTLNANYRDKNLSKAGIFIQAVDFDSRYTEDEGIWRSIAANSTTATPALPALAIPGGCADSQTLYVWTDNQNVAVVDNGANDRDYVFGDGVTRRVSKVEVKPGDTTVQFRVKGLLEGSDTFVYMAATPTNVYNAAGTILTNFTTRAIRVTEALPPGMAVEITPDVVKTSSEYTLSVAAINVILTQPYTEDLTVTLKPTMKDGSEEDPFKYIGLSTLSDGKEEYSKRVLTITIPRGKTSADGLLYLYANRADEHTLKGITFEVDTAQLTPEQRAFFTGAFSSDTIEIDYDGGALKVLSPVEGAAYLHIPGNVEKDFEVTIADAIGELNDGTYSVFWDNNGSGSFSEVSGLRADAKGKLIVPRRYVTAMTYNSQFYVQNEGGARSEIRHVTVQVDAPKTITAAMDNGVASYKEGDIAKVTLDFSDTFEENNGQPGYVFIVPLDEATSNLVTISTQDDANHQTSLLVYPGYKTANSQAAIQLKDGYNGCTLSFGVEVREANDNTQDNIIGAWVGKQFFIGVTNVAPRISYIGMNETPVKVDGGTFTARVPVGVQKIFTVGVSDPGINYFDFADGNKSYTQLKFWENGEVVSTQIIRGVPTGKNVTHTFMNAGTAQVTAKVRDKDMTDQEFDEAPEFTVNVTVVEAPAITLSTAAGSTIFAERDTGPVNGRIDIGLTVAPSGLDVGDSITVVLEVIRNGANDGDLPTLSRYEVPFRNGKLADSVYLSALDGTPQSEQKGFRIRAYIKETTVCPVDTTKTWRQYYTPVDDFDIFVVNSDPKIGPGDSVSTNERPASINVPFTIPWNVSDIPADQQQMTVTWTYNGSSQTMTMPTTGTYSKEITFTSAGPKIVTLTVQDKDGGTDTRSWYYRVEASMGLEITPRRPNTGALSAFSQRYTGAMGIGAGRVWSTSADFPTRVANFTQSWDFQPANDLNPKIYAFGYKVDDTDNGGLGPVGGRDYAIDATGAWHNQANQYGSYYVYRNADGKDSFFYCWLLFDRDEGNSTHLNGTVQPQVGDSTGENTVAMPEYDEEATSYVKTMVEAIFSLEFYAADNVGDINQDGIPDVYAANTTWEGGRLYEFAEFELEEGGDLRNLAAQNGDEDFLPARTARGGTLVETVQNWPRLGGNFTAILELRGFGEGLNFRADNDGMNRNVRGRWISDPSFTPAETAAVARVNGLVVPDPAAADYADQLAAWQAGLNQPNSWIPENRTDPTMEDTDSDGFPDGYEYYFWYSAMVGVMNDDGTITRLVGSRFTLNDIATGELLTSDEIAAAFNPTVAATVGVNERDTDNDGLTDIEEYALGTSPINWDTDGDGLSDYWEVMRGMNPVKADVANGAAMNADGDFMARYRTEADYAVVTIDGQEYALPNNGNGYIVQDDTTGEWVLTEAAHEQFIAIQVFRYGKPGSEIVPRFRGGQVENLPEYMGIAMDALPLDARVWDIPADAVLENVQVDQALTLIHDQVYTQLGFDPRTAWFANGNGYVSARWDPNINTSAEAGTLNGAGEAVNTAPYTARDEYLLLKYRYMAEPAITKYFPETNTTGIYSIPADTALWNDNREEEVFRLGTTNPNVAFEDPDWVTEAMNGQTYASANHGADTDENGVPDGWELYVGMNPNTAVLVAGDGNPTGSWELDDDGIGLAAEFAGTDSCNAYEGCESIYQNHPGHVSGWYNKFFPTDPADPDTDADGIADGAEGAGWQAIWVFGNSIGLNYNHRFVYGPNDNKPADTADDGRTFCIRGGGLNPCTIDTDGDVLPDPWERQFAGVIFANGRPVGLALPQSAITVINRADGVVTANGDGDGGDDAEAAGGQYITAGMDGTDPNDAFTSIIAVDAVTGTTRDFDFDHDGLQNFQEYLVQACRHLRYDDCETPLMGSWMPDGPGTSRKFVSFLPMNIMDGETFYAQCKEAGFAATGAWQFRELGYFAPPQKEWDKQALNASTMGMVNYDDYGYRFMMPPAGLSVLGTRLQASAYCCTDPRLWDTDQDGMDDYYEMFHGLNPLLGSVQGQTLDYDIIAAAYANPMIPPPTHFFNGWTGWNEVWASPEGDPIFDAMAYPWMMGAPEADADGDGLRNNEEALIVNMTPPQPTHTDPTPLWYTDSSALNQSSFTAQYYMLDSYITAQDAIPDIVYYPWDFHQGTQKTLEGSVAGTYMFSFEENEGYDTDNDRVPDADERTMTATTTSDPLKFTDPDRRQALWFPGNESAAVSYSSYFHRPNGDQYDMLRQFTVEAWICPEDLGREQVILERVCAYTSSTLSNNVGRIRANFRLGILADGRVYGCFDTSDAVPTGTGIGTPTVVGTKPAENRWQHIALTYDGRELKLHQNGSVSGVIQTSLIPANGIVVSAQDAVVGMTNFPVLENGYYTVPCAFLLGATLLDKTVLEQGLTKVNPTWDSYSKFYAGYLDEVRVWDGVRTLDQIKADYRTRYRFDDVAAQRNEIYAAWLRGATRNENDGKENLPAELLQHYSFQTLPGATEATDVMWEPAGFTRNVFDNVRDMDGVLPAGTFECGWWSGLQIHSTVYENYCWVPWIQNTCGHLPIMDGSTVDSNYWSEFFGGRALARELYNSRAEDASVAEILAAGEAKKILFPNEANPYTMYNFSSERGYHEFFLENMARSVPACQTNVNLYAFEIRSGFVGTSDLIPLGGAFARRSVNMWDDDGSADPWEVTADGDSAFSDIDGNGIPDWWQDYAIACYGAADGFEWSSLVKWPDDGGREMTAREAYLRDLAMGMLPTGGGMLDETFANRRDDDKDGMPDWWESLMGINAENAYGDHDNDQLSNYAEYLIAEGFSKYGFPCVDPIKPMTFGQGVPDYFLRVGKLYLGEMFTDHDFMSDAWEDKYASSVVSRGVWDALKDPDDDGWSNWAEYQAGTRPDMEAYLGVDNSTQEEYPVPVIEASVVYNGKKQFNSSIVFQAWSQESGADRTMVGMPDASWTVPGPDQASEFERVIGRNRNRKVTMSLGPASVAAGSVLVSFKDLAYNVGQLADNLNQDSTLVLGDPAQAVWQAGVVDVADIDDPTKGKLVTLNRMFRTSVVVGEIDYVTGLMTIDFTKKLLQDKVAVPMEDDDNDMAGWSVLDLSSSYVMVAWTSQKVNVGNGGTYYLSYSDANAAGGEDNNDETATIATKYGHIREGKNMFIAFADMDGDGKWTPGEPYGVASDVAVGWSHAKFAIELTDTAAQMARIDISAMTQAGDFNTADALTDRSAAVNGSYYPNMDLYTSLKYTPPDGEDQGGNGEGVGVAGPINQEVMPAANATARVRIIRTAINNSTNFLNDTVLDREINLGGHPLLTEADLVADGLPDLDWGTLAEAWRIGNRGSAIMDALTNASYRIVYGNGDPKAWNFNVMGKVVFVNAFERGNKQTKCVPLTPKGSVYGTPMTFEWTHEALDSTGYKVKDYPAFRLQVLDGTTVVFDSGVCRAPIRNSQGVYQWTAPLYAGMVTKNGHVFSPQKNYKWQVSMLDAKFTEPNWATQDFRLEATGMMQDGRRYGSVAANVRYFGPLAEAVSTDPSVTENLVHVLAYKTADFVGAPVAQGWVTNATMLTSTDVGDSPSCCDEATGLGVNAVVLSLPAGTYYLCAFIDSNGNGVRDSWESWGYVCGVGSADAEVGKPVPVTVVEPSSKVPGVNIYIEDCDVDNDGFPDAWEYTTFGSLDTISSAAGDTFFTKVNPTLIYNQAIPSYDALGLPKLSTGSDYIVPTLMSVLLGDGEQSLVAAALLDGIDPADLEPRADVVIDAYGADGLSFTVTTQLKPVGAKLLASEAEATISFQVVLCSAAELDGVWTESALETVTVKANDTVEVKSDRLAAAVKEQTAKGASFFKVKLVQK